jgi:hypothetical protein
MVATATVHVEASAADWLAAAVEMLLQSILEFALSALLEFGPDIFKKIVAKYANAAIKSFLQKVGGAVGKYGGRLLGKTLGKYAEYLGKGLAWVAGKTGARKYLDEWAGGTTQKEFKKGLEEAAKQAAKEEAEAIAKSGEKLTAKEIAERTDDAAREAAAKKAMDNEDLFNKYYGNPTAPEIGGSVAKGASGDIVKDQANNATQGARQTAADAVTGQQK